MLPIVPQRHNSHTQFSTTGKDVAEEGEGPPVRTVAPIDCLRRAEGASDPQQQGRRRGGARRRHVARLAHPTTEVTGEGQQLALVRGAGWVIVPPRLRNEEGVGVIETTVVVPRAGLCAAGHVRDHHINQLAILGQPAPVEDRILGASWAARGPHPEEGLPERDEVGEELHSTALAELRAMPEVRPRPVEARPRLLHNGGVAVQLAAHMDPQAVVDVPTSLQGLNVLQETEMEGSGSVTRHRDSHPDRVDGKADVDHLLAELTLTCADFHSFAGDGPFHDFEVGLGSRLGGPDREEVVQLHRGRCAEGCIGGDELGRHRAGKVGEGGETEASPRVHVPYPLVPEGEVASELGRHREVGKVPLDVGDAHEAVRKYLLHGLVDSRTAKAHLEEHVIETRARSVEDRPTLGQRDGGVDEEHESRGLFVGRVVAGVDAREHPHMSPLRALDVDAERADNALMVRERAGDDGAAGHQLGYLLVCKRLEGPEGGLVPVRRSPRIQWTRDPVGRRVQCREEPVAEAQAELRKIAGRVDVPLRQAMTQRAMDLVVCVKPFEAEVIVPRGQGLCPMPTHDRVEHGPNVVAVGAKKITKL